MKDSVISDLRPFSIDRAFSSNHSAETYSRYESTRSVSSTLISATSSESAVAYCSSSCAEISLALAPRAASKTSFALFSELFGK